MRRQDTASAKFVQRPEVKQAVLKIEVIMRSFSSKGRFHVGRGRVFIGC